jgi:hypothetical protein
MRKTILISIIILSCLPLFAQENEKKWGFGLGYEYTLPSKISNEKLISNKHYGTHNVFFLSKRKLNNEFIITTGLGLSKEKMDIEFNYEGYTNDTANLTIQQSNYFIIPLYMSYGLINNNSNLFSMYSGLEFILIKKGESFPDQITTSNNYYFYYENISQRGFNFIGGIEYGKQFNAILFSIYLKYRYNIIRDRFRICDSSPAGYYNKNNSQFSVGINVSL